MNQEVLATKRFFQSQNIILSDFWLESCIEWYREENPGLTYTQDTLNVKVYEQWLLLDLRDVEVPVLPSSLSQQKKTILNGTYTLQMLHVTDISVSKYHQIQTIRNANALVHEEGNDQQASNWKSTSGKRVLHIRLTDGVQEVEAMEYKGIPCLNINLPPGTKIKVKGPVVVRRGQMMLEEKHVNVLGGEVEELLITNAAENVLARELSLPENLQPNTLKEETLANNLVVNAPNNHPSSNNTRQNVDVNNRINIEINVRQDMNMATTNTTTNRNNINNIQTNIRQEVTKTNQISDTRLRLKEETKMEVANEPCTAFKDDNLNMDVVLSIDSPDADVNIFGDMDIDAHLDLIDKQSLENKQSVKKQIGLGELLSNNITSGKFTVQAKFKSVKQKLGVNEKEWSLKLMITDDKHDMEVSVHSDVISDLMGYYPPAIMALKRDIINKDKQATFTVMKIIEELKAKIMNLDCMMEIRFAPNQPCPTITKLI